MRIGVAPCAPLQTPSISSSLNFHKDSLMTIPQTFPTKHSGKSTTGTKSRPCLLISPLCNKQLVDSALQLAELIDDSYLMEKRYGLWQNHGTHVQLACCLVPLSGGLPLLDIIADEKQNQVSEKKENWKLIPHGAKGDASLDLPLLDNSTVKKDKGDQRIW
ncbi:hypothetical protein CR513_39879, partial [Mucuna pruriens]